MNRIVFYICLSALSIQPLLPRLAMGDTPSAASSSKERKFLYIADFGDPTNALIQGFTPRGEDLNLLAHYTWAYSGNYPRGPTQSGFIDIYADEHSAIRAVAEATQAAHQINPAHEIYHGNVYRIRADENFYSGSISLQDLLQRMRAATTYPSTTFSIEYLESSADLANQFVTDRPITGNMIESYAPFEIDYRNFGLSSITPGRTRIYSDHYAEPNTHSRANAGPYPMALPSPDGVAFPPSSPPSESSWTFSSSAESDSEGPAGPDHAGDMLAVAGSSGILSTAMLAGMCSAHTPTKRSAEPPRCPAPRAINLSKRSRVLRFLLADEQFSSAKASGHDEL